MKLTIVFIIATTMLVSASSYSQSTLLTFEFKDITFEELFREIEKQTEFRFAFSKSKLDPGQTLQIDVKNETLDKILDITLPDGVGYEIIDRYVVILNETEVNSMIRKQQPLLSVSGQVTDKNNQPLAGVTIVIKGTNQGTITNAEGEYTLTGTPENAILVFSFIGMRTQEIEVGSKTIINVTMEQELFGIEEVVAIGYGTIKSSRLTYSVSSVKSDDLDELAVSRIDEALMGKLAGVHIRQTDGLPGRAMEIKVRGTGSINFSNAPLYVVDGYPIDGDLSSINTNDIESIEVLKDAASAAIYGSRGSNGVVLITTKQGETGKTKIQFDIFSGLQRRFSKIDLLNRDEWIEFAIEERNNSWELRGGSKDDPNSARSSSAYYIDPAWLTDKASLPDNDWQDIVDRIAPVQSYQLSASGANEIAKYYFSGNYFTQNGILVNSDFSRISFNSNIETRFSETVKLGLNLSVANTNQQDPQSQASGTRYIQYMPPVVSIDGNTETAGYYPYAGTFLVNPLLFLKEYMNRTKGEYLRGNMYVNFTLAKNLNLMSSFGTERKFSNTQYFLPNYVNRGRGTSGEFGSYANENYLSETTLKYQLEKNEWDLGAMAGFSYQWNREDVSFIAKTGYPDDEITTLNVATTLNTGWSTASEWNLISFIGRLNFALKDKYIIAANIRRDGSSRFGSNNRWGWFPSISAGWRIIEEGFMKNISWLDNLKLRGSYGQAGNNNIGNYGAIGTLAQANYILGSSQKVSSGFYPGSFSNIDLGWEKTNTLDFGIDIGILNNRIQLSTDYYNSVVQDLLLDVPIPQITGFSNALQNIGKVRNRGIEFELDTRNIDRALKWNSSFNISFNKNKVLELGPDGSPIYGYAASSLVSITQIGEPIGSYYLLKQEGVFMNQEDFDSHPHYKTQNVGDIKYMDYDKDGDIDVDDIHIVGDAHPDFFWGMQNVFTFKNFDLSINMDGQYGANLVNVAGKADGQSRSNVWGFWLNRWRSPEDPGDGMTPRAVVSANMTTPSTFWMFDASYWTVRNIILGYNFNDKLLNKVPWMNGLRMYFSMDNVYMKDHYNHTPQAGTYANTPIVPNIDYSAVYPLATTTIFGIQIKF